MHACTNKQAQTYVCAQFIYFLFRHPHTHTHFSDKLNWHSLIQTNPMVYTNSWKPRPNNWHWDTWRSRWSSAPDWSWQTNQGWTAHPGPWAGGQPSSHTEGPIASQSQSQQWPQNPARTQSQKRQTKKNPPTIQKKVYSSTKLSQLVSEITQTHQYKNVFFY